MLYFWLCINTGDAFSESCHLLRRCSFFFFTLVSQTLVVIVKCSPAGPSPRLRPKCTSVGSIFNPPGACLQLLCARPSAVMVQTRRGQLRPLPWRQRCAKGRFWCFLVSRVEGFQSVCSLGTWVENTFHRPADRLAFRITLTPPVSHSLGSLLIRSLFKSKSHNWIHVMHLNPFLYCRVWFACSFPPLH